MKTEMPKTNDGVLGIGFLHEKNNTVHYGMCAKYAENYSEENPVIKVNVTRQGKTEEYHININEVNPRNATEIEMFALCSYADAKGMGRGCWESLKSLKLIATHSIISKKAR